MCTSAGVMEEEWAREPAGLDGIPPMYSILKGEVRSKSKHKESKIT